MISEQDKKAWEEAIKDVQPLCKSDRVLQRKCPTQPNTADSEITIKEPPDKMPIIADKTGSGPIEKKLSTTLRKGGFTSHWAIDYHGKSVDEAFTRFIYDIKVNYSFNNRRNLVIVTGRSGQMYNEFKRWCQHKTIRKFIWYVCPAHKKHGGDGAWYVILRRNNR